METNNSPTQQNENAKNNRIKSDERFVRWQTALRGQLSFLNGLILSISIGILGFLISLLKDSSFTLESCQKCFFTVGLMLIFVSIFLGLLSAFSRLMDFRTTVKKIKKEIEDATSSELIEMKEIMKLYSNWTWILFYSQTIVLFLGIVNLTLAFCSIYKDKLF